ncbi:MAG: RidA family protein [Pseudomonadota bacterium]
MVKKMLQFAAVAFVALGGVAPAWAADRELHQVQTTPDPYEKFGISQAIRVGDLVFVSGQVGMDLEGNIVSDDFEAQAEQAFRMLGLVLERAGSGLDRVAKVNIYVTDMSKFPVIVRLREKYFRKPYPADTIVEVSALGLPGLKIEIDAIGVVRP